MNGRVPMESYAEEDGEGLDGQEVIGGINKRRRLKGEETKSGRLTMIIFLYKKGGQTSGSS